MCSWLLTPIHDDGNVALHNEIELMKTVMVFAKVVMQLYQLTIIVMVLVLMVPTI